MSVQLSLSHLGYLPDSPKTLTLLAEDAQGLSETVPFLLRQNCLRLPARARALKGFPSVFQHPTT